MVGGEGSDGNAFTVTDSVVVPVFDMRSWVSADPASNGGVDVDFAYDYNSFKLSNDEDDLTLMAGSLVMSELVYHEDDIELDEGRTINLDPAFMDQTSSGDLTYCACLVQVWRRRSGNPARAERRL